MPRPRTMPAGSEELSCLNRQMSDRHRRLAKMTLHLARPTQSGLCLVHSVLRPVRRRRNEPQVYPLRCCYEGVAKALDVTDELTHHGEERVDLQKQPALAP